MQHAQLLQQLVDQLKHVQGLRAIVLGGSYASGDQRPDSDLDLGLCYSESEPLASEQVRELAATLNDTPDPVVTSLGDWGPWVNGGAWLTIGGLRVDFLYRNLDFVSTTLDECNAGLIRSHYWQQPSYGFHNFIYCTEIAIARPLYDPEGIIAQLKTKVAHYPPKLKQAIIKDFLWRARFTLDNLRKPAARGEVYMVVGGLARAIHCLVQVLYALNEKYYISEKKFARDLQNFSIQPERFLAQVTDILGAPGTTSAQLQETLAHTENLYQEISEFARSISAENS